MAHFRKKNWFFAKFDLWWPLVTPILILAKNWPKCFRRNFWRAFERTFPFFASMPRSRVSGGGSPPSMWKIQTASGARVNVSPSWTRPAPLNWRHLVLSAAAATDRRLSQSGANSERRSGSNRAVTYRLAEESSALPSELHGYYYPLYPNYPSTLNLNSNTCRERITGKEYAHGLHLHAH